ncbi:MAG: YqiA/YcfP family alpha/beta fold hydrolase [bacterium]|nr:YqiA/YcfP family alpha/beta fold hydrolase [bacterium]
MRQRAIQIEQIPAILWGNDSNKLYLYVHGKLSSKEAAEGLAEIATEQGYQVLSFDFPEHGARKEETTPFNIQNGVDELMIVHDYIKTRWSKISLFASSVGAYFSLVAYQTCQFEKCLFLSPIVNMERLIQNMMTWTNVTEQELQERHIIPTKIGEVLDYDYYCYVKAHPIVKWDSPTCILYGSKDYLQERQTVQEFTDKFSCKLTVLEGSEHFFHTTEQLEVLEQWTRKNL